MFPETYSTVSSARITAIVLSVAAVWLFSPEIVHAAVTFGEMGQNVAENAKGVAKGITMGGFAMGAGIGVWGLADMYNAFHTPDKSCFV
jgi:hypothetical protein